MSRNSYVNLPAKIVITRLVFWSTFIACAVIGIATKSGQSGHSTSPALYVLTPFWVCAWIYLRSLRKRARELAQFAARVESVDTER